MKKEFKLAEVFLRPYQKEDCQKLMTLFYETVHEINAKDYPKAQLAVWATGKENAKDWHTSFLAHHTLVAVWQQQIVGFGDMDETGYLDRLYVHKNYQGKKIATLLCDHLEKKVKENITTQASITAKPFFEKRGYQVIKKQQVDRSGVLLTNFVMEKTKKSLPD